MQLYVWTKWVTGPYFVRVPPGPSDPPTWMKIVLVTWTSVIMLGLPVAVYYIIIRPWRRERRITTDGMLLGAFGLVFFQDPLLNYLNTWCTYNTWLFNRGSWVKDVPGWVSWNKPGADDGGAAPHERPRLLVRGPHVHDARMLGDAACQVALAESRCRRIARRSGGIHLLLRHRDGGALLDADGSLHVPRSHPVSFALSRHIPPVPDLRGIAVGWCPGRVLLSPLLHGRSRPDLRRARLGTRPGVGP